MAAKLEVIAVWEINNCINYVLESTIKADLPYLVPNYEKDWLEKFIDEKIESVENYPQFSCIESGWQVPQELINERLNRHLLWRELRASIDGTLRQCNRVIEDVDTMKTSEHSIEYSFSHRSAHIDVIALFCLFLRGIELLELFDEKFGFIANKVKNGGSKYVIDTLTN